MKLSNQIKPISYLKAHAAEIIRHLGNQGEPLIITQNGEAKVVIQDINLNKTVYVYLIADGRRDMQTLLQQRLLQA
jgi:prevent-host-death family protein